MSASLGAAYATLRGLPISGRTTIGYERLHSGHEARDSQPSLERFVGHEWKLGGPWLRQQLAWRERLFVGAGLRLERREDYGANAPETWFKSADASWMLGDLGWLRGSRLRAAYGEGGSWMAGAPGLFAAPVPGPSDPSTPLQPERTAEMEIGADARLGDRLTLAVTAFRVNASDLYLFGVSPPSGGGGPVFIVSPVGTMRNEGVELVATAKLVDRARLRWDATLTAATLRNRVMSLGSFPPIVGVGSITQVGYPIGGYWSTPYTYADANRDGMIGSNEIQVSNSLTYAGSSLPTRETSLRSSLSLPGGLKASGLLDYRGGHKLENSNERVRCRIYTNCRGAQDPASSLEEQSQFAAVRGSGSVDPYLEDASFVKLRELSLTWAVPASWTHYVGGGRAALTLAGRNLATWTSYEGLDPELNFRRFDDLPRLELSKLPLVREVVLRLDIGSGARP
jgi:hypothetical protein